jgi:hypothetical protein
MRRETLTVCTRSSHLPITEQLPSKRVDCKVYMCPRADRHFLINNKLHVSFLKFLCVLSLYFSQLSTFWEIEHLRIMGLLNDTPDSGLSSDQAALERAGKKQVLKVRLVLNTYCFRDINCCPERMELLGGARFCQYHFVYLGGYERSIFRCIHQWRSCVRCLWLHRLRAGHSDDRCFNG